LLDDKPSSIARRELYGKAGAMRPKPYGWEYRVLSNYWMFEDKLVAWVYNQTALACDRTKELTEKEGQTIQHCINTGDKKLAEKLIKKYSIALPTDSVEKEKKATERLFKKYYSDTSIFTYGILAQLDGTFTTPTPAQPLAPTGEEI